MFDSDMYLLCLACRLVGPQHVLGGIHDVVVGGGDPTASKTTTKTLLFYWESPLALPKGGEGGGEGGHGGGGEDEGPTNDDSDLTQREVILLNLTFEVGLSPSSSTSSSSAAAASSPSSPTPPPPPPLYIHAYYGCLLKDGTYWRQPRPLTSHELRRQFEIDLQLDVEVAPPTRLADITCQALQQYGVGVGSDATKRTHLQLRHENGRDSKGGGDYDHTRDCDVRAAKEAESRVEYGVRIPYPHGGSAWIGVGHEPAPLSVRLQMDGCVRNCEWIGGGRQKQELQVTDGDLQPVVDAWNRANLSPAQRQPQQQQRAAGQPSAGAVAIAATATVLWAQAKPSQPPKDGTRTGQPPSKPQPQPSFQRQRKKPKLAGY